MPPRRVGVSRREPELEETWVFCTWTPEALAERYGSLEEARERHDHLVRLGVLEPCWNPGALEVVSYP